MPVVGTPGQIEAIQRGETTRLKLANAILAQLGGAGGQGPPGADGHSPVLTWSGDQIAIDGVVSGPHLTGPAGSGGGGGVDLIAVQVFS